MKSKRGLSGQGGVVTVLLANALLGAPGPALLEGRIACWESSPVCGHSAVSDPPASSGTRLPVGSEGVMSSTPASAGAAGAEWVPVRQGQHGHPLPPPPPATAGVGGLTSSRGTETHLKPPDGDSAAWGKMEHSRREPGNQTEEQTGERLPLSQKPALVWASPLFLCWGCDSDTPYVWFSALTVTCLSA